MPTGSTSALPVNSLITFRNRPFNNLAWTLLLRKPARKRLRIVVFAAIVAFPARLKDRTAAPRATSKQLQSEFRSARETFSEENRSHHQAIQARRGERSASGSRTQGITVTEAKGLAGKRARRTVSRRGIHRGLPAQGKIEIVIRRSGRESDRRHPPRRPDRPHRRRQNLRLQHRGSHPDQNRRIRAGRYLSRCYPEFCDLKTKKGLLRRPDFVHEISPHRCEMSVPKVLETDP